MVHREDLNPKSIFELYENLGVKLLNKNKQKIHFAILAVYQWIFSVSFSLSISIKIRHIPTAQTVLRIKLKINR